MLGVGLQSTIKNSVRFSGLAAFLDLIGLIVKVINFLLGQQSRINSLLMLSLTTFRSWSSLCAALLPRRSAAAAQFAVT